MKAEGGTNLGNMWRKSVLGRGNRTCQVPKVETSLTCLKRRKEAWGGQKVWVQRLRQRWQEKKKKKIKNWISPVKKSVVMQGEEGGFHTK